MKGRGQGVRRIPHHPVLKGFIDSDLRLAIENPIRFVGTTSRKVNPTAGYEATILRDLCEAILDARNAEKLKSQQEIRYAIFCDILMRAFATIGIIALVDEATGYQAERDRQELQHILSKYISDELMPWTLTFPHEFYRQLFRLRGWEYNASSKRKKPMLAGKLTRELVYDKLPPGVIDELCRRNPAINDDKQRHRKYHHHRLLTEDIGHPHLTSQIVAVTTLMKVSPNWRTFLRYFNRAFDLEQLEMQFLEKDKETSD